MPTQPRVDDDFDAWFDDHVGRYRPRLFGTVWELPGALPALKVLRYQRFMDSLFASQLDPDAKVEVPEEFTGATNDDGDLSWRWIIADLVGADQLQKWDDAGLTQPHEQRLAAALLDRYITQGTGFGDLIDAAYAAIGETPDAEGKAPAPAAKKTAAPRKRSTSSSQAGQSSKPAGKRSTAKTSASS